MQVVRLCREHGLYGALIYLFNQGLNDFRTPLEELLSVVQNTNSKDYTSTGYAIFSLAIVLLNFPREAKRQSQLLNNKISYAV